MSNRQEAFTTAMNNHFSALGGTVGVMVWIPETDEKLTYNHDHRYPTASTLKVPVLYELYRQADAGKVNITDRVTLKHADRVCGSGVLQAMDEGLNPTIRDLAELMITVSDNYATDLLINLLGKDNINNTMHSLGLTNTFVPMTIREMFCTMVNADPADASIDYDGLKQRLKDSESDPENLAYSSSEQNDVSSPADMVRLMDIINRSEGLSEDSREGAMTILKNQNFNTIIPARLPQDKGIETAHKTGSIKGVRNDVGTVFSPELTYHIAFMSMGQEDTPETVSQMAHASRWIWDFLNDEA